jgi:hypothetical protein
MKDDAVVIPSQDSARSHLRNALQGIDLVDEAASGDLPLESVRNRIVAALAILDHVHQRAGEHPDFPLPASFARHVYEVV